MKILHLDTRPDWRGGQHQILMTLRGLSRARGQEVQLMARTDSPIARRAAADGFTVHVFSPRFARLSAALRLRQILKWQSFDVVHAHDPHALTAAWLARAHRRAVIVVARRVAYPLSHRWPGLTRYRAASRIIAVSRFVAESVIASGIDAQRVGVVYDGVEIPPQTSATARQAAREHWKAASSEILVGCVGVLLPEKGQEALVRAMPLVREKFSNCQLILAGDGPCRPRLESLVNDLKIRKAVIFAGFVDDVQSIYRALDLFVFPSLAEPLGSSLLTALAYGLPAVAVASGGVPEIIENGCNGLLVDKPAPIKLAEAVKQLLSGADSSRRLGMAARETIAKRFTVEILTDNTLREYQEALSTAHNF